MKIEIEIPPSEWDKTFVELEQRYQNNKINIYAFQVINKEDTSIDIEWDEEGFPFISPNSLKLVEEASELRVVEITKVIAKA